MTLATTNLRRGRKGGLEAVGLPVEVAALALRPLCSMASGHVIAVGGSALWSLRAGDEAGLVAVVGEGVEVYCAVAGGDRAIVMTSAGAHHVVLRGGEPVSLGTLPELPPVELALDDVATLTESTPALTLTDVSALREGALSATDAATLKEHLSAAWQRIVSRANTLGACIIPDGITVTAEVRRLDGEGAAVGSRGRVAVGGGSGVATAYASITGGGVLAPVTLSVKVMKMRVTSRLTRHGVRAPPVSRWCSVQLPR